MEPVDNDLRIFESDGAISLPEPQSQGYIERAGACIWYAIYGVGTPVILLHGGLGHSGNWGYQVPVLVDNGYQAIVIDNRGHGRSTFDARPFTYELMAHDVKAIMDILDLEIVGLVGWSDGAVIALILAMLVPERIAGVFFFGCNMNQSGTKAMIELPPIVERCFSRHAKDYIALSPSPERFDELVSAVSSMMNTEPNYSTEDLSQIYVPVAIVQSEHDEFIKYEHAQYLAQSIPDAEFIVLHDVSHFAPLQRPYLFNQVMLSFLNSISLKQA